MRTEYKGLKIEDRDYIQRKTEDEEQMKEYRGKREKTENSLQRTEHRRQKIHNRI